MVARDLFLTGSSVDRTLGIVACIASSVLWAVGNVMVGGKQVRFGEREVFRDLFERV